MCLLRPGFRQTFAFYRRSLNIVGAPRGGRWNISLTYLEQSVYEGTSNFMAKAIIWRCTRTREYWRLWKGFANLGLP